MKVKNLMSKAEQYVFGLVYGGSGTGKTHLIGTLGTLGRVLVIDIDNGYETIVNSPFITDAMRKNITVVSFDEFGDLDTAFKTIAKNTPAEWSKILGETITEKFDWIVWDTWSEIQWAMTQELRQNRNLTLTGGKKIGFRQNIQIQDWGSLTDLNKLSIMEFKKLPINQLFTMQEKIDKDDITGEVIKGPAIHGKLITEMPAWFGVVVHTYTNLQGRWCASTLPKNKWIAKTRLGVGIDKENPVASDFFVAK